MPKYVFMFESIKKLQFVCVPSASANDVSKLKKNYHDNVMSFIHVI